MVTLPPTEDRVPRHTPEKYNARIRGDMRARIERLASEGTPAIDRRLRDLDQEWDIERLLEANAASISLAGVVLGATVSRRFYALPGIVAGFLLQHALQGWCPPVPLFRRLGVRTAGEIAAERHALKAIRGDYARVDRGDPQEALAAAQLSD